MLSGGLGNEPIVISLFLVSIIISTGIFFITKRKIIPTIFVFSVLSNLIILGNSFSFKFSYRLGWLVDFSRDAWPWINVIFFIALLVFYFKNRGLNKNNTKNS